ncbi:glycosyltransferase [Sphingomonas sp. M1-B02]|uniref:glycosyltransferase n=1 Tax=Sphingomonas sp. M1-B02 TaxID=3114300 RepID=UPI0022400065|nr:glycosyltransferase [Sphingomonas sp. S6-11]UZK67749.1 glycosyltransferase [Sphingomonas sp. S6-11]
MTDVSVVLATYNGASFLSRQLQTLADQTDLPSELIICDDCSIDDTVSIVRDFAVNAPFPVRLEINERRLNFRHNFFKGVGRAASDLIMFCDQDDAWSPHKIATMKQVFIANPKLLLAYHHATVVDAEERPLRPISEPVKQQMVLSLDVPPPWHFARGLLQTFRRELTHFDDLLPLSREHFSDDILGHDRWYFMLALAQKRVGFVNSDLVMYRQHGANAFGSDSSPSFWGRVAQRLYHHSEADRYGAAGARSRAAVLSRMISRVDCQTRPGLEKLAESYSTYADRLDRRHRTYTAPSFAGRIRALGRSLGHGDYCGNPWGFDGRSLARDSLAGVLKLHAG